MSSFQRIRRGDDSLPTLVLLRGVVFPPTNSLQLDAGDEFATVINIISITHEVLGRSYILSAAGECFINHIRNGRY